MLKRTWSAVLLIGGGFAGACGHLPMEELPLEVDGGPPTGAGDGSVGRSDGATGGDGSVVTDGGTNDARPEKDAGNEAPVVKASANPTSVAEGGTSELTADAKDPDGDTISYVWTQTSGPKAEIKDPNAAVTSILAPANSDKTTLVFEVKACDPSNACATAEVKVTVSNDNTAPTAIAKGPESPVDVKQSGLVLDASESFDPDGDPITYEWTQTSGPDAKLTNITNKQASWTSPVVDIDTTVTFQLKVCDQLACSTATVSTSVLGLGTYVSPNGNDTTGRGTRAKPWKTIGRGITTASSYRYPTVFVDKGLYPGEITMADGVEVRCGHDANAGWQRADANISTIQPTGGGGVTFNNVTAKLAHCTVSRGLLPALPSFAFANVTVTGGAATIENCSIDATAGTTESTGINVVSGTATITGGSVNGGNATDKSYGVRLSTGATANISGATIGTASSPGEHRAIASAGGNLTVTGGTLNSGGGGTRAWGIDAAGGSLILSGVTINGGNGTVSSIGVAVVSGAGNPGNTTPTLQLSSSIVTGGAAPDVDGVFLDQVSAAITSSTVTGTSQPIAAPGLSNLNGHGIRINAGSELVTIKSNTLILGGNATQKAVGIAINGGSGKNPEIASNTQIRGGGTVTGVATGISVSGGATPSVHDNTEIAGGENVTRADGIAVVQAGGEYVLNGVITGNRSGTLTKNSVGIRLDRAQGVMIRDNPKIIGGRSTDTSCGVCSEQTNGLVLRKNTIEGGGGTQRSIGFREQALSPQLTVDANVIHGGEAPASTGMYLLNSLANATITNNIVFGGVGTIAIGLRAEGGNASLRNNYFNGQGAGGNGSFAYGVWATGGNGPTTSYYNNIIDTGRIAFTRYGFYEDTAWEGTSTLRNNDFHPDAGGKLYHTFAGPDLSLDQINTRGTNYAGNISVVPGFVNPAAFDFHLSAGSPCAEVALNQFAPERDMDLQLRPRTATNIADIGPDER